MMKGGEKINSLPPLSSFKIHPRQKPTRVLMVVYMCAILALFYHHLIHSNRPINLPSFTLLIADLVFAFMWVTSQAFRWRPIRRNVYPENLSKVITDEDLPPLDVFICTADPYKEPPIEVVNTVLSVLAFDYPSNKISVYISDDGGSQMTLYAMIQGSRFAKHWLPFCKRYQIKNRCPKIFFNDDGRSSNTGDDNIRFPPQELENMKNLYEELKLRVEKVMEKGYVDDDMITSEEVEREAFVKWKTGFSTHDHPPVIQVIMDGRVDIDVSGEHLPNLIYLSREKNKKVHHNFKAGALNVLIRVSAIMTNAPIVLSLDCDMFSNDPRASRKALCHLLDPIEGPKIAFVQFPQHFRGINSSDMYNNQLKRPFKINAEGLDGLGTVSYVGTGPFVNRKAFYGPPSQASVETFPGYQNNGTLDRSSINSSLVLEEAHKVAESKYEQGTNWGLTMGFRYGSLVEDFFTGFRMQCEGWSSVFCEPAVPAFVGDFPISLNDTLTQLKRWSVGLIEVGFSKYCPFIFGTKNKSLLMGMAYGFYSMWPLWGIPVVIYGFLPQLCLLNGVYLFPKVSDQWFYLYVYLFAATYLQDIVENYLCDVPFKQWWNDQRMWMIRGVTSYSFALVEFALKQVGISTPNFSLTSKVIDNEQQKRYDQELFDFGVESPFFVSISTFALINLVSLSWGIMKIIVGDGKLDEMFIQLFISGFVVVNSWPIFEAMVLRSDGGRMPTRVTSIAIFLTLVLCYGVGFSMK